MRIQQSSHQGCVVLTLAGQLDLASAPQLQRAILKQLAQQPPAIICDLAQVEAIDPLCAGVFTSIRHPALGWPATALVLCGTRPAVAEVLLQLGAARHLPMYPSLDQALANARARPQRLRARLTLGPVPTAAGAGRQFVAEVCGHWGLQVLAEPAALVASELVTNAVVHAQTALELRGGVARLPATGGSAGPGPEPGGVAGRQEWDRPGTGLADRGPGGHGLGRAPGRGWRQVRLVHPGPASTPGGHGWPQPGPAGQGRHRRGRRRGRRRPSPSRDDDHAGFGADRDQVAAAGPSGWPDPPCWSSSAAPGRPGGQAVPGGRAGRVGQDDPARPVVRRRRRRPGRLGLVRRG